MEQTKFSNVAEGFNNKKKEKLHNTLELTIERSFVTLVEQCQLKNGLKRMGDEELKSRDCCVFVLFCFKKSVQG